jgi:YHS domain-containing protein
MQPWLYFLVIGALFFFMMRFGCGSHVMGHGHHHHSDDNRHTGPGGSVPNAGPAQVRDPVRGMTIETNTARTSIHHGGVYYFCSDECRSKFEASPATYAVPAT